MLERPLNDSARSSGRHRLLLGLAALLAIVGWASWSYVNGGVVYLMAAAGERTSYDELRSVVAGWGPLAPLGYTLAVVVEVVVAPIPGTLLYAPAGLLFGGFLGGSLSLAGNVLGAALCCFLGGAVGQAAFARQLDESRLEPYVARLRTQALWVVLLLRINPLTSSDLVSYAAGAAGVPVWKVAAGTAVGLAPLCYAQAYLAEQLFGRFPAWLLVVSAVAIALVVLGFVRYGARKS